MLTHVFVASCSLWLLAAVPFRAADGKDSKTDRGYVRTLVEIKGQLYSQADPKIGPRDGFVRVGDGFSLQVFFLDCSEAPKLREQGRKLHNKWVVLTGNLKPPGSEYKGLGYSGTVTVKTLKEVDDRLP
jgi:hypothetical protein